MQYLFLLFVILTTAKAQGVSEEDSCYSTEDITVPYTIWIGTNIQESHTTEVTTKRFTPFYAVIVAAAENDPGNYGFEATCSQYGHYVTSIGGHSEDKSTSVFWLLFALQSPPNPLNPPSSEDLSPTGVDGIHVVNDTIHYLFWLRNITDFYGQ